MAKVLYYIPLDKSWIIRMGILDLTNNHQDISYFLKRQNYLGNDLMALKKVAENWNTENPLDAGESGTLYRFVRFAAWKLKKKNEIIKGGTLTGRKMCDNPEIIDWPIKELLNLDGGTSQWASASVIMGNKERLEDIASPPEKLKLSYEAVGHWKNRTYMGLSWIPRYDKTIEKQARAYIEYLKTGEMKFEAKHSEDYCFARAFDKISKEQGLERFPQIVNHESNRIEEMETVIRQIEGNEYLNSKDHRCIQAGVMRQFAEGREIRLKDRKTVNKTWLQFWDFMNYAARFKIGVPIQ